MEKIYLEIYTLFGIKSNNSATPLPLETPLYYLDGTSSIFTWTQQT